MKLSQAVRRPRLLPLVTALSMGLAAGQASAQDMAAMEKWVDEEFQPSTLTRDQQLEEMKWFAKAAEPFRGMEIKVVSETIPTHDYESKVLTKAFEEITGIKVTHDLIISSVGRVTSLPSPAIQSVRLTTAP